MHHAAHGAPAANAPVHVCGVCTAPAGRRDPRRRCARASERTPQLAKAAAYPTPRAGVALDDVHQHSCAVAVAFRRRGRRRGGGGGSRGSGPAGCRARRQACAGVRCLEVWQPPRKGGARHSRKWTKLRNHLALYQQLAYS